MDILSRTETLTPPFRFLGMEESILGENQNKSFERTCRYSTDNGESWSEYNTINSLTKLFFGDDRDRVLIEFRYKLKGMIGEDPTFVYANPILEFIQSSNKRFTNTPELCYNDCTVKRAGFSGNISDCSTSPNQKDPYEYNRAFADDLAFYVNNKFGHDVEYYKTNPEYGDILIMGWNLLSVEDCPYQLKMIVDNNEFPDSKPSYDPMGIKFEKPFEVSITKLYWEERVGINTRPQRGDFLLFKRLNRMYEVDSTYTFNNYSGGGVYYKIQLIEYSNRANRIISEDTQEDLDTFTQGFESLFGKEIETTQTQITKPIQNGEMNKNKYNSEIKISESKGLKRVNKKIHLNWTVISHYSYDLSSISENIAVTYIEDVIDFKQEDRSVIFWCSFKSPNTTKLFSIGDLTVTLNGLQQIQINKSGTILKNISLSNKLNPNIWYSFIYNFNKTDNTIGIYVYELPNNMKGNLIEIESKVTKIDIPNTNGTFKLYKGDMLLTGLKYLKTVVPKTEQISIITQQNLIDEHIAIILDNAEPNNYRTQEI